MPLPIDLSIAPNESIIRRTAEYILLKHREHLPGLDQIVVLLPNQGAAIDLRTELLQQSDQHKTPALIPPWCGTLHDWLEKQYTSDGYLLSEHERRLLFIEALEQNSELFHEENKWQVSLALLQLFDELNLQQVQLAGNIKDWENFIQLSYGLLAPHLHLHQEAALVHTLWNAWHQQLEANQQSDASLAYVQILNKAMKYDDKNHYYYIITPSHYSSAEYTYIEHLQQQKRCYLIDYDYNINQDNDIWQLIHSTFDFTTTPLLERIKKSKTNTRLPFTLFQAADAETEARAIDLQIRKYLFEGHCNIGVVCEDRKLSRRLRALLERSGIPLQDMAGWSLATTSASAVLERWLECIETDFDCRVFLDLLKSHFIWCDNRDQHLDNVYRLEHDIILQEKIAHGLERYKQQLASRLNRLPHWPNNSYTEIEQLLEVFAKTALPLQKLYTNDTRQSLSLYLSALKQSMEALGTYQTFSQDAAGINILQLLDNLENSVAICNPALHWQDFRNWLGMALEEQLFRPQDSSSAVQLMTLEQSTLKHFDALIIAASNERYFPGTADSSPFFNQAVRHSLGLPTWEKQREKRLQLFKHLLLAADAILITCTTLDHGEPVPLSPWVEALRVHSQLNSDQAIDNTELKYLMDQLESNRKTNHTLPSMPVRPAPAANSLLLPEKISASAHQRLINCPYQYFAADILALKPSEEISEELQKSDYGNRVHKILQAFHQQVKDLPAPFSEPVTVNNRDAAIAHMQDISQQVFAQDQQDKLLHRSWLHRWQAHIPAYIDWQIEQQQITHIKTTEQYYDTDINEHLSVYGRVDRVDQSNTGDETMIIDFKTGKSAHQDLVDSGEDVQLITYAMLDQNTDRVMYLSLDETGGKVKTGAQLSGDTLQELRTNCEHRLHDIFLLMNSAHPLTAWGDENSCQYCNFSGLCRRNVWNR